MMSVVQLNSFISSCSIRSRDVIVEGRGKTTKITSENNMVEEVEEVDDSPEEVMEIAVEDPSEKEEDQRRLMEDSMFDIDLNMVPTIPDDEIQGEELMEVSDVSAVRVNGSAISLRSQKCAQSVSTEYSVTKAAFHIFKGNVGAAIFSLGSAYAQSGAVAGTIIVGGLAMICVHCMLLLVHCKQSLNDPQVQTYGQVACAAFGRGGKHAVDIFIVITQLGFCCVYYQFASSMLHTIPLLSGISVGVWVVILFPMVTALTFLPNMNRLVPAAMFATFATIFALIVGYGYSVVQILSEGIDTKVAPVAGMSLWPMCVGKTISAFEGIGLVLPIENSMKDKEQFPSLLKKTFVLITTLYISFGMLGYFAYATILKGEFTEVLPKSDFLSSLIRLGMAIAIAFTFPLQFFPAAQIIEGWLFVRAKRYTLLQPHVKAAPDLMRKIELVWRNLLSRTVISLVLAMLAIVVSDMSTFLVLIGGIGGAALAVILPPMLHLKLIIFNPKSNKKVNYLIVLKDVSLTMFGIVCGVLATYDSLKEMLMSEEIAAVTMTLVTDISD